ncbi:MAG: YhjD/YihY/BrkB family envelope integrity protein [Sedimentisphaeraceae bacterium JB056]
MIFSEKIHKFKEFISTPFDELGHVSRFIVFQFRLWPLCAKLLRTNRADQQAAALAYHSIFGFIPLAIMLLIIFQSFPGSEGIGEKFRDMVYEGIQLDKFQYPDAANPEQTVKLTDHVNKLIGGFFEKSSKGPATLLSGLFVFWAAIKLLTTIERTFNNIWNVSNGRGLLRRIFYYWTPLTLGPLLIGAGLYIKTLDIISKKMGGFVTILNDFSGWMIPILAFFLLYWSMPNTKVRTLPALWASSVAAVLWVLLKELYGFYIVEYMPFRELYGVLGLIPLSMLWIYISWLVVLFGVQLAYTTQNLEKLDAIETSSVDNTENFSIAGDDTIIAVMGYISDEFDKGNGPVGGEKIVRKFSLPYKLVYHILGRLVKAGVLVSTSEPNEGYSLARSSDKIFLSELKALAIDHRIDVYIENCQSLKEASEQYGQRLGDVTLSDINVAKSDV